MNTFMRAIWQQPLPEFSTVKLSKGTTRVFEKLVRPSKQSMLLMAVIFYREYSHRAQFLYGSRDDTGSNRRIDQFMETVFAEFKDSTGMKAAFVSFSDAVSGITGDAVLKSITYAMFSELLCDFSKTKSKNSRVLLEKNPKREKILERLNGPLGKKVVDTLAPLHSIDSKRGLRSRIVVEKVMFRALDDFGVVVSEECLSSLDKSVIFDVIGDLERRTAVARDGLTTLRIRQERSFKTLATKKRPGVWEFLSDAIKYFTKLGKDEENAAVDPPRAGPSTGIRIPVEIATPAVASKKFVAITALFQKRGQVKSISQLDKAPKISVCEALLIVEVDDKEGEKGVIYTPLLTNARLLYVKSASGSMTSAVKERVMFVQSALYDESEKKV